MTKNIFDLHSDHLRRTVSIQYLMVGRDSYSENLTILFNDGQDFTSLKIQKTIQEFEVLFPEIQLHIFGISAGDRVNEYGSKSRADYKGRGYKAPFYNDFIVREFMPYIRKEFNCGTKSEKTGFAGFSLGGLSAFDIVINNPKDFAFCGAFSGSFWWRHKPFTDDTPDDFRIMHEYLEKTKIPKTQRFWFEAGTEDETCDRNGNGIIDSIDDTLHLIEILKLKGLNEPEQITYLEVLGGRHDQRTWGNVMIQFLRWSANGILVNNV